MNSLDPLPLNAKPDYDKLYLVRIDKQWVIAYWSQSDLRFYWDNSKYLYRREDCEVIYELP